MQTPQDFMDDDLSLFYYTTTRAVVQVFNVHNTNGTARNIFDYLLLNYSRKLNHTHKIDNSKLADWKGCSEATIRRELAHLKKIGAIRPHPDKIAVYIIPSLNELRNTLHEYRLAVKEADFQKRVDEALTDREFEHIHDPRANPLGKPFTEQEKADERKHIERHIRADDAYKERANKRRKEQAEFDMPFGEYE